MPTNYQDLVAGLAESERAEYEAQCGVIERDYFGNAGVDLQSLSRLLSGSPLRPLLAVHALKLWLERCSEQTFALQADAVYRQLGFVLEERQLADEIWRWVQELGLKAVPQPFWDVMPTDLAAQLESGRRVFVIPRDRFEFLRQLNTRGMAVVVLVRHKRLDQQQVLKALHPELRENPVAVEQFRREARLLLQAAGPGIVRVIDCDESEGWPYFTMEYYPGGSLAERLVEGPLSQVQAAEQIAMIARSLHQVHRLHGLVHRDIKPANIFYPEDGRPALGDFGLARQVEGDWVHSGTQRRLPVLGTRGYIAPEILDQTLTIPGEDDLQVWKRADVFSLGATLYQCLTGRLPYQSGAGPIEIDGVLKHEVRRPRDAARVDVVLDAICMRAIRRDPRSRFSSALELAEELDKWVVSNSREVPEHLQSGVPEVLKQETRSDAGLYWYQRTWFVAGTALLVVMLAAAGVVSSTSGGLRSTSGTRIVNPATETGDQLPDSSRVAALQAAGWRRETAMELVQVAEPILTLVAEHDPEFAKRTWDRLGQLKGRVPDVAMQRRPHLAGALIQPSFFASDNQTRWLRVVQDEADASLIDDLLVRLADPDLLPDAVRLLDEFRPLLRNLHEREWIGAEQLLRELPEGEAGQLYGEWLRQMLQVTDSGQSLEMLSVSLLQGRSVILPLLQNDERFRKDFLSRIWPAFRDVTYAAKERTRRFEIYAEPLCWEFLKLDKSRELLEMYGPGVCAVFVGSSALPADAHPAAAGLLLDRRTAAIKCFEDAELRRSPDFAHLLTRRLTSNELSALCALLQHDDSDGFALSAARRLAGYDDDLIRRDLTAAPPGFLDKTPVVYLKIGWKVVSGERVYPDEWARVAIQGLKDAATLASMGASAAMVPVIEGFKTGLEAGDDAAQEARIQLLNKLKQVGSEQITAGEMQESFSSPSEVVDLFLRILQAVQKNIDEQRHARVLDSESVRQFFASASMRAQPGRVVQKADVNFLRLRLADGFECCVPQLRRPPACTQYGDYISELTKQLSESGPELKPRERRLLTGRLCFAWFLLQHPEAAGLVNTDTSRKAVN